MAKVLIVGRGSPEKGGIPTFMETLLASDLAIRHDLRYLNLGRPRGTAGGKATISNMLRTFQDTVAVLHAAGDVDVVHLHSAFAPTVTVMRAFLLCAAARLRGARTLVHVHGGRFPGWARSRAKQALVRLTGVVVDRYAVVAAGTSDALSSLGGRSEVVFVPNGIDLDRFSPSGEEAMPPVVLYVGVLTARKGLLELFEASRLLHARGVDHELRLVGGVPDEGTDAYEEIEAAAPHWARFVGEVAHDRLASHYGEAAVFCLPSWWEAAPLTLLEAAASGLAVVASRVGDVPALVENGHSGLLVDPRDPLALTEALGKVLTEGDIRKKMGLRGRQLVEERFSLDAVLRALDGLYTAPQ